MSLYSDIINWIRGTKNNVYNNAVAQTGGMPNTYQPVSLAKQYPFGVICSGGYANAKHDPNPTILCLGTYMSRRAGGKVGINTHAINLHYLSPEAQMFLFNLLMSFKKNNIVINPRTMFYYLLNSKLINRNSYRTYFTELCNFKIVSPGCTSMNVKDCAQLTDARDGIVNQFNNSFKFFSFDKLKTKPIDRNELNRNIAEALNSRVVWNTQNPSGQ